MNSYDKIIDVEDELIYNPFLNKKRNKIKLYKNYGWNEKARLHLELDSNGNV